MTPHTNIIAALLLTLPLSNVAYADCPTRKYTCDLHNNYRHQVEYGQCFYKNYGYNAGCADCNEDHKAFCPKGPNGYDYSSRKRWMTQSPSVQNGTLMTITIPGAHDAGMGRVSSCKPFAGYSIDDANAKDVMSKVSSTQDLGFHTLLDLGIRYFDIRPVYDNTQSNKLWTGHYSNVIGGINFSIPGGCSGHSMDEVLDKISDFLRDRSDNNKEVLVLNFSHFMTLPFSSSNAVPQSHFNEVKSKIISKLGPYLVKNDPEVFNRTISSLTKSGPRAIAVVDSANLASPADGIYETSKLNNVKWNDYYANKRHFDDMKADQMAKLKSARSEDNNNNKTNYLITSWTLTLQEDNIKNCILSKVPGSSLFGVSACRTIQDLAYYANNRLHELKSAAFSMNAFPNVVLVDFATGDATQIAIDFNARPSLRPLRR